MANIFRKLSEKFISLLGGVTAQKCNELESKINKILEELLVLKEIRLLSVERMSEFITNIEKRLDTIESEVVMAQVFDQIKFDITGVASFKTDANGKCIWVSKPYQKLCNISLDDALGEGWMSVLHPDDKNAVINYWNTCTKYNSDFNMEFNYINLETKEKIPVSVDAFRIVKDHQIIGWVGTVTQK